MKMNDELRSLYSIYMEYVDRKVKEKHQHRQVLSIREAIQNHIMSVKQIRGIEHPHLKQNSEKARELWSVMGHVLEYILSLPPPYDVRNDDEDEDEDSLEVLYTRERRLRGQILVLLKEEVVHIHLENKLQMKIDADVDILSIQFRKEIQNISKEHLAYLESDEYPKSDEYLKSDEHKGKNPFKQTIRIRNLKAYYNVLSDIEKKKLSDIEKKKDEEKGGGSSDHGKQKKTLRSILQSDSNKVCLFYLSPRTPDDDALCIDLGPGSAFRKDLADTFSKDSKRRACVEVAVLDRRDCFKYEAKVLCNRERASQFRMVDDMGDTDADVNLTHTYVPVIAGNGSIIHILFSCMLFIRHTNMRAYVMQSVKKPNSLDAHTHMIRVTNAKHVMHPTRNDLNVYGLPIGRMDLEGSQHCDEKDRIQVFSYLQTIVIPDINPAYMHNDADDDEEGPYIPLLDFDAYADQGEEDGEIRVESIIDVFQYIHNMVPDWTDDAAVLQILNEFQEQNPNLWINDIDDNMSSYFDAIKHNLSNQPYYINFAGAFEGFEAQAMENFIILIEAGAISSCVHLDLTNTISNTDMNNDLIVNFLEICSEHPTTINHIIQDTMGALNNLNILNLSHNNLNGAFIDYFKESTLPNLSILDLSHNVIYDDAINISPDTQFTKLTFLNLSYNRMTEKSIRYFIIGFFPDNVFVSLRGMNLSYNRIRIDEDFISDIQSELNDGDHTSERASLLNQQLTTLNLTGNIIDDHDATLLFFVSLFSISFSSISDPEELE